MEQLICQCGSDKLALVFRGIRVLAEVIDEELLEIDWNSVEPIDPEFPETVEIECRTCGLTREFEFNETLGEME